MEVISVVMVHTIFFFFLQDIAVLTNDATRCDYYKSESENVKGRWACVIPRMTLIYNSGIKIPNNEEDCDVR